jgi:hypothetical protein
MNVDQETMMDDLLSINTPIQEPTEGPGRESFSSLLHGITDHNDQQKDHDAAGGTSID